jgi:hypothetical protein
MGIRKMLDRLLEERKKSQQKEPKNMGLVLQSLIKIHERTLDIDGMHGYEGKPKQVYRLYEETKDVLKQKPNLKTAEEILEAHIDYRRQGSVTCFSMNGIETHGRKIWDDLQEDFEIHICE